jgi:hypothetical protein
MEVRSEEICMSSNKRRRLQLNTEVNKVSRVHAEVRFIHSTLNPGKPENNRK